MIPQNHSKRPYLAQSLLILVTFFWGTTFVLVKAAIEEINLHYFLFYRFLFSAIILGLLFPKKIVEAAQDSEYRKSGFILGLLIYCSFLFQTVGLTMTTASNAAFVTGMNVVLVPLIAILFGLGWPSVRTAKVIVIAFVGLFLLILDLNSLKFNEGDGWVFLCAVTVAFHIILCGKFAKEVPPEFLAWSQIATTAVLSLMIALTFAEGPALVFSPIVIVTLIVTTCFATVFAYVVQSWAQSPVGGVTSSRVAIIFVAEPVFALIIDVLLGTALTWVQWIGAGLILSGMLLAVAQSSEQDFTTPRH